MPESADFRMKERRPLASLISHFEWIGNIYKEKTERNDNYIRDRKIFNMINKINVVTMIVEFWKLWSRSKDIYYLLIIEVTTVWHHNKLSYECIDQIWVSWSNLTTQDWSDTGLCVQIHDEVGVKTSSWCSLQVGFAFLSVRQWVWNVQDGAW